MRLERTGILATDFVFVATAKVNRSLFSVQVDQRTIGFLIDSGRHSTVMWSL